MPKIEFQSGGVWESNGFDIETDHKEEDRNYLPCKHAHSKRVYEKTYHPSGHKETMIEYTIPYVAVQINEGGYSTTGTCAQCIAEALQTLINA